MGSNHYGAREHLAGNLVVVCFLLCSVPGSLSAGVAAPHDNAAGNRSSLAATVDAELCGAPCGAPPNLDAAVDSGLYLWEENCGDTVRSFSVRALQGGSATVMTYEGGVDSDLAFVEVTPLALETSDVLEQLGGGLKIAYRMSVRSPYSECRRAQDAKRDIPVALSPCARRQPLCPGSPRSGPRLRHFAPTP